MSRTSIIGSSGNGERESSHRWRTVLKLYARAPPSSTAFARTPRAPILADCLNCTARLADHIQSAHVIQGQSSRSIWSEVYMKQPSYVSTFSRNKARLVPPKLRWMVYPYHLYSQQPVRMESKMTIQMHFVPESPHQG